MDLRDYTPERICEALGWLYGGTFDAPEPWEGHDSFLIFCGSNGARDIYQRTSDGEFFEGNYSCMFGVSKKVAHALDVTAPWEWTLEKTGHWTYDGVVSAGLYPKATPGIPWWWWMGTTKHEDTAPDVESAQSAARAAYLRWMRGGLER
jgi:hypothetical protein